MPSKIWKNGKWQDAATEYVPNVFISNTAPDNPIVGTLWLDSTTNVLNMWNGTAWISVGAQPNNDQIIIAQRMFG